MRSKEGWGKEADSDQQSDSVMNPFFYEGSAHRHDALVEEADGFFRRKTVELSSLKALV